MNKKEGFKGLLYIAPSLVLFIVFTFYPFIRTIYQSLCLSNNRGMITKFVGLNNYFDLFQNPLYIKSIKQTFIYVFTTVPFTVCIALLLAVIANERLKGMRFFKTVFTSTMGISVAAGSVFWNFIFHPSVGILNKFISLFGTKGPSWLVDPKLAIFSIAIITIWMNTGFAFLMISGGLKNIDRSYYESVEIVGGGFWFKLTKVIIPLLSPTLFFVLTVSIIGSFQTFGIIDMLTQGGPMGQTNLMVYSIYKDAFVNFSYGSASAQGVMLFLVIFIVSRVQSKLTERWVVYQ